MSLLLKPHTVAVQPAEEVLDALGTVVGPDFRTGSSVKGQLTPEASTSVFERWGLELLRPHLFLCDAPDAVLFKTGYRVTFAGRTFRVMADPKVWDAEASTSHAEIALDELNAD